MGFLAGLGEEEGPLHHFNVKRTTSEKRCFEMHTVYSRKNSSFTQLIKI